MEKEMYEMPEMEIVELDAEDIITTSGQERESCEEMMIPDCDPMPSNVL